MEGKCLNCGKYFNGKKGQKFCSRSCSTSYKNKQNKNNDIKLKCQYCSKDFIVSYKERNRVFCSKNCYAKHKKGKHSIFTDGHKQNISKAKLGKSTGSKLTQLNYEWWIQKGLSEIEAKNKVSEIQTIRAKKSANKTKGIVRSPDIKEKISESLKENWNNKSEKEKDLLRIKNSKFVKNFWSQDNNYVNSLKRNFSDNRIEYNKTIQKEYLLNLSDNRKEEIANKKRNTYNNKTDEEKEIITKKRVLNSQKSIIKNTWGKKIFLKNGTSIIINSSFEEKFIYECENQNIEIKRGPIIKYLWNNQTRFYFIDFEINKNGIKYLVELKGKHKWYFEELNNRKLEAKQNAAKAYLNIEKKYKNYIFILNNIKNYKNILEDL